MMSSACRVQCPIAWDETGTHSRYTTIQERACGVTGAIIAIKELRRSSREPRGAGNGLRIQDTPAL